MKRILHTAVPMLLLTEPAFSMTDAYSRNAPKIFMGLDAPHLPLLTNHIPIFVTFSGLVALVIALWKKDHLARQIALMLRLLGSGGLSSPTGSDSNPTKPSAGRTRLTSSFSQLIYYQILQ